MDPPRPSVLARPGALSPSLLPDPEFQARPRPAPRETIVVTGSAGRIGRALCERLAARFRVIGLDRPETKSKASAAETIGVDLSSDGGVAEALHAIDERAGRHLASVVHLAAHYDFSGKDSPLYDRLSVQGTRRLIRGLQRFQADQFIFASTMLVHAPCRVGQTINEKWPLRPAWPYPASKLRAEQLLIADHGRIPIAIFRIAGVYSDECDSLPLAQQMKRIYERTLTSHLFPGDARAGQAYIHVDDVVDAIATAIDRRKRMPAESVMLLGEPDVVPYGELQNRLGRLLLNHDWATVRIPKFFAQVGAFVKQVLPFYDEPFIRPWMIRHADEHYALDIANAKTTLSWRPIRRLRDSLPKMVDALHRDPDAWYRRHAINVPEAESQEEVREHPAIGSGA